MSSLSSGEGSGDVPLTLRQAISANSVRHPDQTAILHAASSVISYGDLQKMIDATRAQLRAGGFASGMRIGVLMPQGPEAALTILAITCSAIAVPLDPRQTLPEFQENLNSLSLDGLVLLEGTLDDLRIEAERKRLTIITAARNEGTKLSLSLDIPVHAAKAADSEPAADAPAFILRTSGTTGQPKLIPFSHSNMLAAAARMKAWFSLDSHDRCLSVPPPFYSHGLTVTLLTPLLTGGSVALPTNPALVDLTEWFELLRPTWYSAAPTLHRAILDNIAATEGPPLAHTLRFALSGGAPLPQQVRENLQAALEIPVLEHYGSSEAAQIAANIPSSDLNKPGTCGKPWPGTAIIADQDGQPRSVGEQGELWVRGPTVTKGYLNAPDLNREVFVDGWFRTGDIASIDEDGFLSLHGRWSELINRGGEKISPVEIDGALLAHPDVAEAAAFAIPHQRLGEDVAAAVVLRPNAAVTPGELRRFLQQRLTSFKIPRHIEILDRLPKGATGKILRRELAQKSSIRPDDADNSPAAPTPSIQLESELLGIWRRLLKSEELTIDDGFFANGGDSLLATEMLIEVERIVGHHVPESIMFDAETIRELAPRIQNRETPIYELNPTGNKPPLFLLHGDFSEGGLWVRRIAKYLGKDQPIVTINPHGLHNEAIPPSVEEMARDRLPLILERQPSGPFLLAGHCNGALVAFEIARLLREAGHEVGLVAMIDPPSVSARPAMRMVLKSMRPVVSPHRLAWIYHKMVRLEQKTKATSVGKVVAELPWALIGKNGWVPHSQEAKAYTVALAHYLPEPLDVPVAFYAASCDGRPWRRLTRILDIVEVPGGHHHCLTIGGEDIAMHLQKQISIRFAEKTPIS